MEENVGRQLFSKQVTDGPNHGELNHGLSSQSVLANYTIVIGVVTCLNDILPLVEEMK